MKKVILILIVSFNTSSYAQIIAHSWDELYTTHEYVIYAQKLDKWKITHPDGIASGDSLTFVDRLKSALEEMPVGHKSVRIWMADRQILPKHPDDVVKDSNGDPVFINGTLIDRSLWWDNGLDSLRKVLDTFFYKYKNAGGELDYIDLDSEIGLSNWYLNNYAKDYYGNNKLEYYTALRNDPRFNSLEGLLGGCNFINDIMNWQNSDTCYLKWNAAMEERIADYLHRAIYEPIVKHFPNVVISDYKHAYHSAKYPAFDAKSALHKSFLFGKGAHVGTHQSWRTYGLIGQGATSNTSEWYQENMGIDSLIGSPFNSLLLDINYVKSIVLSSDIPIAVWIAFKSFLGGEPISAKPSYYDGNDYYQEMIFHNALSMTEEGYFLYWNARKNLGRSDTASPADDQLVNDCLAQINELIGTGERIPLIDSFPGYNIPYVLSGVETETKRIWRLTLDDTKDQLEDILISNEPATFIIGAKELVFPNGVVFYPNNTLSESGYWIVEEISTGIAEDDLVRKINVFPNPSNGSLTIEFGNTSRDAQISIISITGKEVYARDNVKENKIELQVDYLSRGIYFVKVQCNNEQSVFKFLRQ